MLHVVGHTAATVGFSQVPSWKERRTMKKPLVIYQISKVLFLFLNIKITYYTVEKDKLVNSAAKCSNLLCATITAHLHLER